MNPKELKNVLNISISNGDYHEWKVDNTVFIFFPTKIVPEPKITVGLGDTISSLGFVLG